MAGVVTKFRVCAKQVLCFLTSKIRDAAHLNVRAQLFEGRLALNPGLNLTRVSISFVQKHFLG